MSEEEYIADILLPFLGAANFLERDVNYATFEQLIRDAEPESYDELTAGMIADQLDTDFGDEDGMGIRMALTECRSPELVAAFANAGVAVHLDETQLTDYLDDVGATGP